MEVEPQQFSLQVFYERLIAEEVPDDTVRKGVTVQLQISCTQRATSCMKMVCIMYESLGPEWIDIINSDVGRFSIDFTRHLSI